MITKKRKSIKFPKVGQRIIRSVCAVFFCFVIYYIRGQKGIPFYSALAVLQCMQPYKDSSRQMAKQRTAGTFIGAFFGLIVILLQIYVLGDIIDGGMITYLLISIATGCVIYITVILDFKNISYFACVVFLSIAVNHINDANPFMFVMDRILDTLIGIAVSFGVNSFHLPRKRNQDILFVSGVDDVLLTREETLTSYNLVEFNRLIERGANITVSTGRTPASLLEAAGSIRLRLPVIVMDGAALYDIEKRVYLLTYVLSCSQSKMIMETLERFGVNYFANVVMDHALVIYYEDLTNPAEQSIYQKLSKSPYRNYVKRRVPDHESVVYFMIIDKKDRISTVYRQLAEEGMTDSYKIRTYDSKDYEGYAYIKIYHKESTRKNMLTNLKAMLNIEKSVVFGSDSETCDIMIPDSDNNLLVKQIRKLYEPIRLIK